MSRYDWLHMEIDTATRLALVADTPIAKVVSAPAHAQLRNPAAVAALVALLRSGDDAWLAAEAILLGVFTRGGPGGVELLSVECLDGHHRLVAALAAARWRVVGEIPLKILDARVNGWPAHGGTCEERWIPLGAAQRAGIPHRVVSAPNARGATAAIDGAISALDSRFAPEDRGVPLSVIAESVLAPPPRGAR